MPRHRRRPGDREIERAAYTSAVEEDQATDNSGAFCTTIEGGRGGCSYLSGSGGERRRWEFGIFVLHWKNTHTQTRLTFEWFTDYRDSLKYDLLFAILNVSTDNNSWPGAKKSTKGVGELLPDP